MQRLRQVVRIWAIWSILAIVMTPALAAPSAEYVIDARSGEVLYQQNADTKLHPASLTKMMTLYVVFDAISRGELSLDTKVTVSKNAASKPPSKLYLKAGQQIELKYLIRAAAIKSANDAAATMAEAVSGSEAAFGARMTRTARALGMNNTTLKNPHGLDASGHLSTAHDMTTLGRALFYHFPEYYSLFSRRSETVNGHQIVNTNRRLLDSYAGADGIKTGYTNDAGFNLVASAQRGKVRIIATKFGGTSGAARNARVAQLLDIGFQKAKNRVATRAPRRPDLSGEPPIRIASAQIAASAKTKVEVAPVVPDVVAAAPAAPSPAKIGGTRLAVATSARPAQRPGTRATLPDTPLIAGLQESIEKSLSEVAVARAASTAALPAPVVIASARPTPIPRPRSETAAAAPLAVETPVKATSALATPASPPPQPRPGGITFSSSDASATKTASIKPASVVVPRLSTSDSKNWGITVGTFNTRYDAERALLKSALVEIETLDSADRKVVQRPKGYSADFEGMDQRSAELACQRLISRNQNCTTLAP